MEEENLTVRKYGMINNVPITILARASKGLGGGKVAVQSLITGDTAVVPKTSIKGITTKYPKLKK